jgi:hypothetical protein
MPDIYVTYAKLVNNCNCNSSTLQLLVLSHCECNLDLFIPNIWETCGSGKAVPLYPWFLRPWFPYSHLLTASTLKNSSMRATDTRPAVTSLK